MSRSYLDFLGARAVFLFSAQGVVVVLTALVNPGVDEMVAIEITAAIIF